HGAGSGLGRHRHAAGGSGLHRHGAGAGGLHGHGRGRGGGAGRRGLHAAGHESGALGLALVGGGHGGPLCRAVLHHLLLRRGGGQRGAGSEAGNDGGGEKHTHGRSSFSDSELDESFCRFHDRFKRPVRHFAENSSCFGDQFFHHGTGSAARNDR